MKLIALVQNIQEQILLLERVDGVEPVSERKIRRILRFEVWGGREAIGIR